MADIKGFTTRDALAELKTSGVRHATIKVYEWPVCLWHWVNAACITVLAVTGWLIGNPLWSVPGEASAHYIMGDIRFVHFAAGHLLAAALLGRIYWALVGNLHARQIFVLPLFRPAWWSEVLFELKWYLFLERTPKKYVGHNPMAHLIMAAVFMPALLFQIFVGFALFAEGAGESSWQHHLFGWVITLAGNTQWLHSLHTLGMWIIVLFALIHIYAAIREDIMSRQTMVSTIINGYRAYKDDLP